MPDTTTPVLGLVKQTIGGNRNTWGGILNSCMDLIEGAFYGMTSKVVTGSGDVTLTDSERRARILSFSGTLGANQNIIIPNLVGRWTVRNATTGDFSLFFKTSGGGAVVVPQGGNCSVWCDGNNSVYADLSTRLRDTQMLGPSGTDAAPGYSFKDEVKSGLVRVSAGVFAFVINGVKVLSVSGTALIAEFSDDGLDIDGDVSATGDLDVDGAITCASLTVGGQTPTPIGGGMDYDGIFEPNGWKFRNGQALSRTTYELLFNVLTVTANATRNGTTGLSAVSKDLTGLGLEGAQVEGTGITAGTTISAMTSNTITLSQAATGSGTMEIRILPHGAVDSSTFNLPNDKGRVNPGRDNMGGTSADRLTGKTGGINGDRLGATGGEEAHELTAAENGPHDHDITDKQHAHGYNNPSSGGGLVNATGATGGGAGVTNNAFTGITGTEEDGDGDAHNNVQPSRITNKIIFTGVYT